MFAPPPTLSNVYVAAATLGYTGALTVLNAPDVADHCLTTQAAPAFGLVVFKYTLPVASALKSGYCVCGPTNTTGAYLAPAVKPNCVRISVEPAIVTEFCTPAST